MLRTVKNTEQSFLFWILLVFSGVYLTLAFPFSYFRHDDWLILGNVARFIPQDWKFLFEPYLFFNTIKEVWFFRPWFKLFVYLNYLVLGFRYYAWLTLNLVFTLGALVFGYFSLLEFKKEKKQALLFVAFFISSLHFHFGSLVWVGEGAMNCPQLFFLFLNFYCFSKSLTAKEKSLQFTWYFLSLLTFMVSLGFKESSIFHLPFLLALLFHYTPKEKFHLRKFTPLIPFGIVGLFYLYFRLQLLPINQGYKPQTKIQLMVFPALTLMASLSVPLISLLLSKFLHKQTLQNLLRAVTSYLIYGILFAPFFIAYVGHGFFSPGWLLTPGIYVSFLLGLKWPKTFTDAKVIRLALSLNLVLSGSLVAYQTMKIQWWTWYKPQKQIVKIIEELGDSNTKRINIFNCQKPEDSLTPLIRVVGYDVAIQEVFWLKHKTQPKVSILPCTASHRIVAYSQNNSINLSWSFPEFTIIKN